MNGLVTRRWLLTSATFLGALAADTGRAQPWEPEEFDVASVKASRFTRIGGEGGRREKIEYSPQSLMMRNVSLSSSLQWAYGLREFQIVGPEWRFSENYDIAAKVAEPVPPDRMRRMLQRLLAERFRIASHREIREMPLYALTVRKNGPRLRESSGEGEAVMTIGEGSFIFKHTSMQDFADDLSSLRMLEGRPVFDKTEIHGRFDFQLRFADTTNEMRRGVAEDDGPSVFELLQRQLGLNLEAGKGPVEVLVIDHAERVPAAN
ncbi:MAG: TIGR03435 family protein [Acidobacteriota bacterium]